MMGVLQGPLSSTMWYVIILPLVMLALHVRKNVKWIGCMTQNGYRRCSSQNQLPESVVNLELISTLNTGDDIYTGDQPKSHSVSLLNYNKSDV